MGPLSPGSVITRVHYPQVFCPSNVDDEGIKKMVTPSWLFCSTIDESRFKFVTPTPLKVMCCFTRFAWLRFQFTDATLQHMGHCGFFVKVGLIVSAERLCIARPTISQRTYYFRNLLYFHWFHHSGVPGIYSVESLSFFYAYFGFYCRVFQDGSVFGI
jgi:hypothetical protein